MDSKIKLTPAEIIPCHAAKITSITIDPTNTYIATGG